MIDDNGTFLQTLSVRRVTEGCEEPTRTQLSSKEERNHVLVRPAAGPHVTRPSGWCDVTCRN